MRSAHTVVLLRSKVTNDHRYVILCIANNINSFRFVTSTYYYITTYYRSIIHVLLEIILLISMYSSTSAS